ncbi:long-chain fatty acid--CoA ligase [Variovorax robiniae]|uniref:Long-chain fatty acid--CoA ligase n=1 Tax=Variovorax robiniae TaxID=1836199 RepID=A0ABU8XEB8_9BURK
MDRTLSPTTRNSAHAVGLAEWLKRRGVRAPHKPALTCDGVTWSYGELIDRVERMSTVLAAGGVTPGARVGYLGFNDPMFLVVMFAASRIGAIFVPLNFRLTGPELAFIINDAGIHSLVVGESHIAIIDEVRGGLNSTRYIHRAGGAEGWEAADALMAGAPSLPMPAAVPTGADDVALIMYTSGTTGHPKGAMLTNGNFWANNLNEIFLWDLGSTDVTLNFAPMFHVGGLLCGTMSTLLAGGHVVLQRAFEVQAVLDAIVEYRVTITFGVPAMLLFISQHPSFETADLSSLRSIAVGGAPMPEPLLRLYEARKIPVQQGYGMTETASMITFLHPDRTADKLGSSGTPPMMTEIRLLDANDQEIDEAGVPGEICVRGSNVMPGYWNRPEVNASIFTSDGWFRSGDIGYRDADGFLFLCDRLKDMVISGGENVYPAEVESVLYDHPDIAEVAVIGAPDERWGERVVAVVAPKPGKTMTLEALNAFAGAKLARYKLPKELRIVEALPRNPTGKVLKAKLREHNVPAAATNA